MSKKSKRLVPKSLCWATAFYFLAAPTIFLIWSDFCPPSSLNEWGDFFAGLSAPAAFMWLIAGYFLQARELRNSISEMRVSNREMQKQSSAILDNELHIRRDVFLRFAEIVDKDTNAYLIQLAIQLWGYKDYNQADSGTLILDVINELDKYKKPEHNKHLTEEKIQSLKTIYHSYKVILLEAEKIDGYSKTSGSYSLEKYFAEAPKGRFCKYLEYSHPEVLI